MDPEDEEIILEIEEAEEEEEEDEEPKKKEDEEEDEIVDEEAEEDTDIESLVDEGEMEEPATFQLPVEDEDDDDEDDDQDENYLQKFNDTMKRNIISEHHPELEFHNSDEVEMLSIVTRNENGVIVDPLHRTLPFITKYERARILGERARQLDAGATAMVDVDPSIIDGYLIALKEFEQKKIPFILKRPLPSGGCEYWPVKELEVL